MPNRPEPADDQPARLSKRHREVLTLLADRTCDRMPKPGETTSSATFADQHNVWIHWRTARSLADLGLVALTDPDPDYGWSVHLTDAGWAAVRAADKRAAEYRAHLAAVIVQAQAADWPCDNYTRPQTCLTAPSTKAGRCDWCSTQALAADTTDRDTLARVRALADEWAGQQSSGVKIHCGRRLLAALGDAHDDRGRQ